MKHRDRYKCWILRIIILYGIIFTAVTFSNAADLTIKSFMDQASINLGQQFTLSVEISGKGVNSVPNPQPPDLTAFAAYLGSGSSQNIQLVNGAMSVSKTINYYFMANQAGKFQIGSITVVHGGKAYQTEPISFEIQQSGSQPQATQGQDRTSQTTEGTNLGELFLQVSVNKKTVYQNEPVIMVFKIYTRLNVSSYGLSKLPGTAGFWTEDFTLPQQAPVSTEVLNGKKYTVATIKKTALFPMSPGTKTIDPMVIDCDVQERRRSRDPFDDFFSDPFLTGRTVRKTIQSSPVNIQVLPLPETGKPNDFSGAVGKFRFTGEIDKTSVKTNEAISLKLKIEGQGNVRTFPEPRVSFPSDFEVYPPKVTEAVDRNGSAISGNKTFEYVLVPRIPGQQRIKPVEFSWFDPEAKTYRTLKTDEFVVNVAKGTETYSVVPSGISKEEVKLLGQDIRFIKTGDVSFSRIGGVFYKKPFLWMWIVLPLVCIAVAFMYRRHLDRIEGDIAYARGRKASQSVRKRLSKAKSFLSNSTQKEFYAEIGKAMLGYIGDKMNIAEAGIISENVKKLLLDKGVETQAVEQYFECLNICDLKRFSPTESNEKEMKRFYSEAEEAIMRLQKGLSA